MLPNSLSIKWKFLCYELNGAAQKIAKNFADKPARSLAGIKRLLSYSIKDLKDYLKLENQVLLKMLGHVLPYW